MYSTDAAGQRTLHDPTEARFFERGSTGPGALASTSRRVLGESALARYDVAAVLGGWNPRS
jgi:hypothetical protein